MQCYYPEILVLSLVCIMLSEISHGDAVTFSGFEFQPIEEFLVTSEEVLHMENDLLNLNNILCITKHDLMTVDQTHSKHSSIFSSGSVPFFGDLSSFHQVNESHIVLTSDGIGCILIYDRHQRTYFNIAGNCSEPGFLDGVGLDARFHYPAAVVSNSDVKNLIYITDTHNDALRTLRLSSGVVETLLQADLNFPTSLSLDMNNNLIVSNNNLLLSVDLRNQERTRLVGDLREGNYSLFSGNLLTPLLNDPRDVVWLSEDVMVVADKSNNQLIAINIRRTTLTSPCNAEINPKCMGQPQSLLLLNGILFIGGQTGMFSIKVTEVGRVLSETTTESQELGQINPSSIGALVAGLVTGVVFLFIIPIIAVILYRRRRRRKKRNMATTNTEQSTSMTATATSYGDNLGQPNSSEIYAVTSSVAIKPNSSAEPDPRSGQFQISHF